MPAAKALGHRRAGDRGRGDPRSRRLLRRRRSSPATSPPPASGGLSRDATPVPPTSDAGIPIRLDFPPEEAGACPLFVGRVLRGLRNGPEPGLAAAPPEGHRPAADLGPGRHHQLRHLRPRPAPARLRCGTARGRDHPPLGARRRGASGARRPDLPARARDDGHRRRARAAGPGRHHGRRDERGR